MLVEQLAKSRADSMSDIPSSRAAMILGLNVKRLRDRYGWTQAKLAKEARVSPGLIAHIESGMSFVGGQIFDRLADALGVGFDELMKTDGADLSKITPPKTLAPKPPTLAEALSIVNASIDQIVLKKRSVKKI